MRCLIAGWIKTSLLTSLFLLPLLQHGILQNHEASLRKKHENATAVRVHQHAQGCGYLEDVNFLHVLYISQPCFSAPATPQNQAQFSGSRRSRWSTWTFPSTPCTSCFLKGHWCSQYLSPDSTKGTGITRVVGSTVYLHCLTETISISRVKLCSTTTHKIPLSCSLRLKEWKIITVPLNICRQPC